MKESCNSVLQHHSLYLFRDGIHIIT